MASGKKNNDTTNMEAQEEAKGQQRLEKITRFVFEPLLPNLNDPDLLEPNESEKTPSD